MWSQLRNTLVVLCMFSSGMGYKAELVTLGKEEQVVKLLEAQQTCDTQMLKTPYQNTGPYCNRTWDGIMCWDDTEAGSVSTQPCPTYINGFNTRETVSRTCQPDSTWLIHPKYNTTWTNFSLCVTPSSKNLNLIEEHVWRIKLLYNVGYGVSIFSLVLAVIIMISFKRLHCSRNTLHVHLFISFILRGAISFVKENAMVKGLGLRQDISYDQAGHVRFIEEGTHWQCKFLMCLFNYVIGANYLWIFVEALYLHMLIFVSVLSDRNGVLPYIFIGWVVPITFVGPWIAVRITFEDVLCWNTHPTHAYAWIIRGPIVATIIINFVFFLNIVRFLFTKLRTTNTLESPKYRKLAKSTLVLIPLFGVHYIVFVGLPDNVNAVAELVKLYFEMLFNSFQGFFVALLFCFFNGEVQGELRKFWYRYKLRSHFMGFKSRRNNSSNYVTWARTSLFTAYSAVDKPEAYLGNMSLHEVKPSLATGTM